MGGGPGFAVAHAVRFRGDVGEIIRVVTIMGLGGGGRGAAGKGGGAGGVGNAARSRRPAPAVGGSRAGAKAARGRRSGPCGRSSAKRKGGGFGGDPPGVQPPTAASGAQSSSARVRREVPHPALQLVRGGRWSPVNLGRCRRPGVHRPDPRRRRARQRSGGEPARDRLPRRG